jgi:ribosomal protein S18 acetylase RimI-like enzyme
MAYTMQHTILSDDGINILSILSFVATFPSRKPIPPVSVAKKLPEIGLWTREWGRPGDDLVCAIVNGSYVGAAWYRLFAQDEKAPGFLHERIPAMAIAVLPGYRRQGIGSSLLEALKQHAQAARFPALSLSVARANEEAIRLYIRQGFQLVEPSNSAYHSVMRVLL